MKFTKEQLKAIGHREGHLQLIACAGSGKTEVVARRVANLLDPSASPRFAPANIIAFTFTDKAAAELKQRVIDRVREAHGDIPGLAEMFVGTIHAFWASSQASAIWAGVTDFRAAIATSRSTRAWFALRASGVKRGLRLRMSELSKVALSSILPVR